MSFTPSSGRGPTLRMAAASPLRAALFGLASLGTGLVLVAAPDPGRPDPVAMVSPEPGPAATIAGGPAPTDGCAASPGCATDAVVGGSPAASRGAGTAVHAATARCAMTAVQVRSELLGDVATPVRGTEGRACDLVPDLSEPVVASAAGGLLNIRVEASPADPGSATVSVTDIAGTQVLAATIAVIGHGVDCTVSPPRFTSGDWGVAEVIGTDTAGSTVPGKPGAGLAVLGVHRSETITDPVGGARLWRALRVELGIPGSDDGLSPIELIVGEATAACV